MIGIMKGIMRVIEMKGIMRAIEMKGIMKEIERSLNIKRRGE